MISLIALPIYGDEYIVKAQAPNTLHAFVEHSGLVAEPLVTYPEPSSEVLARFGCYWVVSVPEEVNDSTVDALKTLFGVEYIEPNLKIVFEPLVSNQNGDSFLTHDTCPYTPNDSLFSEQLDKQVTQTHWAWNISKGAGIAIAFIDSGIDTSHEDLVENLDKDCSWNFVADNENVWDDVGHGTFVSGVAAAQMDNYKGIAGIAGECSIWALKVGTQDTIYTDATVNAILYAADKEAGIINMSFGSFREPILVEEEAIEYAYGKGVFLCASAGNDNEDATGYYPASYGYVIGVGGTKSNDARSPSSNFGPDVGIYAPGSYVWSTMSGNQYTPRDGTSLACAQIAGLGALIRSVHPELTSKQVRDKICESADTITIDKGKVLRMNSARALDIDVSGITDRSPQPSSFIFTPQIQRDRVTFSHNTLESTNYSLKIFDVTGSQVASETGRIRPGKGEIVVNNEFSRGVYLWRITADDLEEWGKVVLVE
ncbi:S8 family serine peptidase [candidate division WOR-3 bacterium]|nr:S8 family serine peptidase [candidate division WOR-3 bacterium]